MCSFTELPRDLPAPGGRDLNLPASGNTLDRAVLRPSEYSLSAICFKGCF